MTTYQLWFAVRYIHLVAVAVLPGGAAVMCVLCASAIIIWRATLASGVNGACVGALLLVPAFARVMFNGTDPGLPWAFLGLQLVAVAVSWFVGASVGLLFGLAESVL